MRTTTDQAPPRVAVPADIDTPDRIVFGLTGRQLVIVGAAAAGAWFAYRALGTHVPPIALVVAGIPIAGIVAVIALGCRDGLGMDAWLAAALRLYRTPRLQAPAGTTPANSPLVATVGALVAPAPLRLPADAITPDGLVRTSDRAAAVVAAGTVNLALRTGQEQAALLDAMARWLNSLTGPAQIVVCTQRVDLEPYAARLEADAATLAHPALSDAACDHAAFLRELAATRDPLRRSVLVVVGADPRERGGAARRGADTARALAALGVPARLLDGPAYTAALAAAVDPYAPPVPGARATPDQVISTDIEAWS
jgi:PrgI family protein